MTTSIRFICMFAMLVSLFSCNKESALPDDELPNVDRGFYELIDMRYSLGQGDGIDTATVKLTNQELFNYTQTTSEQLVQVDYSELTKKSQFSLSPVQPLPNGLSLDTIQVLVPSSWYSNEQYSLDTTHFPLSNEEITSPYKIGMDDKLNVKVPAKARVVVDSKIDRYTMRCTFQAVFKNRETGIIDTIRGKWNGTLRYDASSITLNEYPLSE